MSNIVGVCEKAFKNKAGYYSVLVNEVWYGTGKTDYSSMEGQTVEFTAAQKGKFWNVDGDVRLATPKQAAEVAAAGPDQRQKSIVLQASYKIAGPVLAGAISAGTLGLGAKNKAYENMLGYLDELAKHVYYNCIDPESFLDEDAEMAPGPGDDEEYDPANA